MINRAKLAGCISTLPNGRGYQVIFSNKGVKIPRKTFSLATHRSLQDALHEAEEYQQRTSTTFGLTKNQVKLVLKDGMTYLRVKVGDEYYMKCDCENRELVEESIWNVREYDGQLIVYRQANAKSGQKYARFHNLVCPEYKKCVHINGDTLDNRKSNLTDGTIKMQIKTNKTGITGVSRNDKYWIAQFQGKKKTFSISEFTDEKAKQKAIDQRKEWEEEYMTPIKFAVQKECVECEEWYGGKPVGTIEERQLYWELSFPTYLECEKHKFIFIKTKYTINDVEKIRLEISDKHRQTKNKYCIISNDDETIKYIKVKLDDENDVLYLLCDMDCLELVEKYVWSAYPSSDRKSWTAITKINRKQYTFTQLAFPAADKIKFVTNNQLDNRSLNIISLKLISQDYNDMTVKELKELLRKRHKPVSGIKSVLVARLTDSDS